MNEHYWYYFYIYIFEKNLKDAETKNMETFYGYRILIMGKS